MITSYDDRNIYIDEKVYDLNGLNTSHIIWHLSEMYKPERFLNNLNESFSSLPSRINHMSLAEGVDYDALLVDDRMYRYSKLNESDRNEVQEYINKYAYSTALLKLSECANIIGSGLEGEYNLEEAYTYTSSAYGKLISNCYKTEERGRLVESFGNMQKIEIYEGVNNYIRGVGDKRNVEDWSNPFDYNKLYEYDLSSVRSEGDDTVCTFITKEGIVLEAVFEDVNAKLVDCGLNIKHFLPKHKLVESAKVGYLNEYQQPFTIKKAVILLADVEGDKVKLGVQDVYGNRGTIYITPSISIDEFVAKYKDQIEEITDALTFDERLDLSGDFLEDASDDIASISKLKGKEVITNDEDAGQSISWKWDGFTPFVFDDYYADTPENEIPDVARKYSDTIMRDPKNKNRFKCIVTRDSDGKFYTANFDYIGEEPINDFIASMNDEVVDYDMTLRSDVANFQKLLQDYGVLRNTSPLGNSTAGRNYNRVKKEEQVMEAEGVQVSDIAPKLDQGNMVQLKTRKRKQKEEFDFNKSDLLLSSMNEADEFYGAKGFIKDEKGRYHFNDYYITEGGKVVHKSKLVESEELKEDQKSADELYYKANDAEKILFEIKALLTDETLIKIMEDVIITLNNIRMEGYKQKLQEAKIADVAANDGIRTYFDLLFDEEPQSQYDKMLKHAIDLHDQGEDLKKENPDEARKLKMKAAELMYKADMIPEENRGPLYAEFKEIDKANQDEFAQAKGYKDFEDYMQSGLVVSESSVDDVLVKQGKCPYCTGPMSEDEYKVFGMCSECYDNGVE